MPQITGTPGNDDLTGTPGDDQINGLAGADHMAGLAGNDVYYVDNAGDVVIEANGEGSDIVYSSTGYTLNAGAWIELLSTSSIAGTQAIDLTGNNLDNTIWGNIGANTLSGGVGGHDTLVGFGGNDVYLINNGDENVVENAGEGTDIVYVNASYSLSANASIELLSTYSIASTQAIELTGNNLDNTIWGNRGNNTLSGGVGGNDTLVGFLGNDTYLINNGNEVIVENAGEGTDIVYVNANYTLSANASIELLSTYSIAGTAPISLTGNNLDNTIWGNRGDNTLSGGFGGTDTLVGFLGNDTFLINNGNEVVVENAGEGTDIVYASTSYVLSAGASIELLSTNSIGGLGAIDLTGNELVNTLWGNGGANVLNGGAGSDTLTGFGGADHFAFTAALGAGNIDLVTDFTVGVDKILLGGGGGEPFAALASGALAGGAVFIIGSGAQTAEDVILYDGATGALSYDADGNGAGAAAQFATLSTGLSLTGTDFTVSGPANHSPVIGSGATASLAENSQVSTIVYQAAATDADGDRITWSLGGADASAFTIDANGAVRLNSPANFEVKASYSFSVIASDSGPTPDVQAVALTITDVNESGPSTPIFNEIAGPNDSIGTAQAIDRALFVVAPNPNLPNASLPSGTILGRVSSFSDGDYYAITLQAGEKIVLDVDGTTEGLDSQVFFYDSGGNLLISNDDKGTPDPGSGIQFGHNTDSFLEFRVATSGTFYFKIAAFSGQGQQSLGNYQLNVSIAPFATPAQIAQETADKNIDNLISGDMWDHNNLTYGFPTSPSQYPTQFSELSDNFEGFNSQQIGATQQLLQQIASVSQLTFAPNSFQPGQANLRFAMSDEPDVAYAYYPTNGGPSSIGGTAWFRNSPIEGRSTPAWDAPLKGNYAWMGILHETGHALGLKHGHEDPALSPDRDSLEYSVMTYRSYIGSSLQGGYANERFGYPQTLMQYDIGALQRSYGANFNFNSGDSVYTWNPGTGEMSINDSPMGAPGDGTASGNRVFMTIWDGGGNDTYNLSNYGNGTTIDLRPGEWSKTSQVQTANLGDGNFARGNIANALLYNGNPASLIENAVTGPGNDVLVANQAGNHLTGGGGADIFRWMTIDDAGVGALADTITDFLRGSDVIDFSQLDAIPTTAPRDAFSFIGTAAFHNVVGEVRYVVIGGAAHIFADADGNGVADMEIIVNDNTILTGSDFNF